MQYSGQYKEINSQVIEQANAGLVKLRSSLAYMVQENFMYYAALFLCMKIQKKLNLLPI